MLKPAHERVLDSVTGGERTWGDLRAMTGLSDGRLGFVLGELFDARKIWTEERGGARVYGLERRRGLSPRAQHAQRRAGDKAQGA
jgi:hypothetical protein